MDRIISPAGKAGEAERIPNEVWQNVDQQNTKMGSTGGHRTQDIRLAILQLRLGLYQLDHPQDKGDCKGHDHGGNNCCPMCL